MFINLNLNLIKKERNLTKLRNYDTQLILELNSEL